jgi:predicted PurR-regulated permease PerM
VLAIVSVGAVLYFGRAVLAPIALALFFSSLLAPPVRGLRALRLPYVVGAALVMIAIICGGALVVNAILDPAQEWLNRAPQTLQSIERKVRPVQRVLAKLDYVTSRAERVASGSNAAPQATTAPAAPSILKVTQAAVLSTATTLFLTFFFLAGGPPLLARLASALAGSSSSQRAFHVVTTIQQDLGRYFATIAIINLGLGTATTISLSLLGLPTPLLWGTMAAVLNFVPYIGSAVTLTVLTVVALVTFDQLGDVLAVALTYLTLATIEGQLVQPFFVGRRLEVPPLFVFLGLWIGGSFWGICGVVLTVPAVLVLKVIARELRWETVNAVLNVTQPANRLKRLAQNMHEKREVLSS